MFRPEPVMPRKNLPSQRWASIPCFSPGFKTSEDSFDEGAIPAEGGNRDQGGGSSPRWGVQANPESADAWTGNCGWKGLATMTMRRAEAAASPRR